MKCYCHFYALEFVFTNRMWSNEYRNSKKKPCSKHSSEQYNLDRTIRSKNSVYTNKNTSDKDMSGLQSQITHELQSKGYSVMTSPTDAYYWVQVNVLKAEKMDLREGRSYLDQGYQGAAAGAAIGGGIAAFNTSSTGTALGIGLASGLIGMAADSMVEDVNYTMITDIQVAERTQANVTTTNIAALKQGNSGRKVQTSETEGNQHKYQTRIVSNANKVNLKFEEAKPVLEQQLAKAISNIL